MSMNVTRNQSASREIGVDYFLVDKVGCSGCVSKIERSVSAINGVQDVRVNFDKRVVAVRGTHSPQDVLETLNHQGFAANAITVDQAKQIGGI